MRKHLAHILVIAFLITSALLTGCVTSTFKFTQVYQPVMLGNVDKIGGSEPERGPLKAKINIENYRSDWFGYRSVSGNVAGIEMLIRLKHPPGTDSPKEKVVIETVYFRSFSTLFIMVYDTESWTGITGTIYEDTDIARHGKK
jgi:hypothetical protein